MSGEKYIRLDVHQATISVAVMDSAGKLIMESILETKAFSATANAEKGDVLVDQPQQMILGNLIF